MYTLQIRIYELKSRTNYYGELYEGEDTDAAPVATAHLDGAPLPNTPFFAHTLMMQDAQVLCREIAQNLAESLY